MEKFTPKSAIRIALLALLSACSREPVGRTNMEQDQDMAVPTDFSWPMDAKDCPPPPNGKWLNCSGCWCTRDDAGNLPREMWEEAIRCDRGDIDALFTCEQIKPPK